MNIVRLAALGAVWLGLSQTAQAQSASCVEIATLPALISQPGVYCLKKNFAVGMADGIAIEIAASNVTIDFNGFKIGNLAGGEETVAIGVAAFERRNIILRNGNFRGFMMSVGLLASGPERSSGHLVENMMLDASLVYGILAVGNGVVLRNNQIVNSADTRVSPASSAKMMTRSGAGGDPRQLPAIVGRRGDPGGRDQQRDREQHDLVGDGPGRGGWHRDRRRRGRVGERQFHRRPARRNLRRRHRRVGTFGKCRHRQQHHPRRGDDGR
jgi:hypothetical protein